MEHKIIEKLQNCIKIKNIILQIINIKEANGICCLHVTDPWDPLQDVYPNIVIENANEIQICRNSKYIKLIDYNFKFNCKTRINYYLGHVYSNTSLIRPSLIRKFDYS
jgi:hypothetical protein